MVFQPRWTEHPERVAHMKNLTKSELSRRRHIPSSRKKAAVPATTGASSSQNNMTRLRKPWGKTLLLKLLRAVSVRISKVLLLRLPLNPADAMAHGLFCEFRMLLYVG